MKKTWLTPRQRLILVVVVFIAITIIMKTTGIGEYFDRDSIQQQVNQAGMWGGLLFVLIFSIGELLHIPGIVFVAVGIVAYGKIWGYVASWIAAIISVSTSFVVIRAIGGKALAEIKRPRLQKILARLDDQPIRTVIYLRLFLWMAPSLNYALAMTNLRLRHYVIGSSIGLIVPLLGVTLFFDWFLQQ